MQRKIIFGDYDSFDTWGLTLTGYKLTDPEYKSNFVPVPGRDGDLDLSTAMTDGEPRFGNRTLTATFELSSGTRDTRLATFNQIVNALSGRRVAITLPDDSAHYLVGRVSVTVDYCDPYHGALTVTAICEPWRQAFAEKSETLTAASTVKAATLTNAGRRLLVPTLVVSGAEASVTITFGTSTWALAAGTYKLPDLLLRPGDNSLTYKGTGTIALTWREAVL